MTPRITPVAASCIGGTIKNTLLCSALLLALPAHAEWVKVPSLGKYIDPATVKKTGYTARVWTLIDLAEPVVEAGGADKFQSIKSLEEFDCKEERQRRLQTTAFSGPMATGRVFSRSTQASEWNYVEPGSIGRAALRFICS